MIFGNDLQGVNGDRARSVIVDGEDEIAIWWRISRLTMSLMVVENGSLIRVSWWRWKSRKTLKMMMEESRL
ncbi:uncharacterized protein HKW66_Vig0029400 [Vigna angularis]|uniref:Uncharacterized protein n=1 Tax=Phaseolus angularis TaxID=3914 RepID=A0A8T0LBD2_PHAAN|nr:uncharacterized protein HKW66_Vig0029400 [Vigna angularis]